jgi:hypothetical protein
MGCFPIMTQVEEVYHDKIAIADVASEADPAHVRLAVLSSQAEIESPNAIPGPHAGLTRTAGRSAILVLHDLRTSQRIDYTHSHVEQTEVAV